MSHDLALEKFKTWIGTKRFVQWSTVKVSTLLALEEDKQLKYANSEQVVQLVQA